MPSLFNFAGNAEKRAGEHLVVPTFPGPGWQVTKASGAGGVDVVVDSVELDGA